MRGCRDGTFPRACSLCSISRAYLSFYPHTVCAGAMSRSLELPVCNKTPKQLTNTSEGGLEGAGTFSAHS